MTTDKKIETPPSQKAEDKDVPDVEAKPNLKEKGEMGELAKTIIIALLLAFTIRTFLYEPFNIPSGSMLPTLKVGDYLFVSKPAYGYSAHSFPFGLADFEGRVMNGDGEKMPKRGDVIVFKLPTNPSVDYIKRLIGMPGDRVQVINGRLYLNGTRVEREPVGLRQEEGGDYQTHNLMEYIETLPGGIMHRIYEKSDNEMLDNTAEYKVPAGHYFLMGDNRDNSQDSRVQNLVGFVPHDNLVGRADILFFSVDQKARLFKPWTWISSIRFSRIFDRIGPVRPEAE